VPSDFDNELLKEGIQCFKAGNLPGAKRYFERALEIADDYPTRAGANFHLALLSTDPARKREYLEEVLAIDPVHPEARRALAILDGRLKPGDIVDPNALPAPASGPHNASADRFVCPNCGGRMSFAPDGRSLVCEYCARSQTLGGQLAGEQDFFAAMATSQGHNLPVETQVFACKGCGAQFILSGQVLSVNCAYCGSPHVLRQSRALAAPDAILPFGFTGEEAQRTLAAWAKKERLAAGARLSELRPLYLPVWTFDVMGSIPWSGQTIRDKRLVPISGEKPVSFHRLLVPATKKIPGLMEAFLEGFNFSVTAPYDARYLAGWPACVQEISLAEAALEARRQAVVRVRTEIHAEYGHIEALRYMSSAFSVDAYNLVLLPAWLGEIRLETKTHPLVMNAVSGQVHSHVPRGGRPGWLSELLGG
jgi:hypothetical protein